MLSCPSFRWRVAIFAILTVYGLPTYAMVFEKDDRLQILTDSRSPYSPIGIVYGARETRYATATLIDDCHVLTVQHIFGTRYSPIGMKLWFKTGMGTAQSLKSQGEVVAAGGLEVYNGAALGPEARARDWLLLRLETCLGKTAGSARLVAADPRSAKLQHVQTAGFPVDRRIKDGLTIDPSCRIRSARPLVWLHDCATRVGNSGGPIFHVAQRDGESVLEVYAIESGGWPIKGVQPLTPGYENQATPAWQILPHVARFLKRPQESTSYASAERQ